MQRLRITAGKLGAPRRRATRSFFGSAARSNDLPETLPGEAETSRDIAARLRGALFRHAASDHCSNLDGLVLAAVLSGEPVFVAKRELAQQFVAGPFLRALGAIFVDRLAPEIAVEDARRAVAAARTGRHFVFFPEGSFTWEPGLRPFRMGAFAVAAEVGLPNLRVAIRGTRSILRSDHWLPRRGRIDVHLGPPLAPAGTGLKRRSDCTTKRGPNSSATAATRSRRRLIVAGQRAQRLFDPRLT